MNYCIINGKLTHKTAAFISVEDRCFRFGDGIFETIAVVAGVPYQFDWHMARLKAGLAAIKIAFDMSTLKNQCRDLLHKNALESGILRIQVSRGVGSLGYMPNPHDPRAGAMCVIQTTPLPVVAQNPVALWQSSYQKISTKSLPVQYKTAQGLNSTLARLEAAENGGHNGCGCADALMLNEHGHISETSSGNIFWLKNGTLYTPSLACGVLEGATRHAVIRLSPYPVAQIEASLQILLEADAVFITNVVWRALAVAALFPAKTVWNSAPLASHFRYLIDDDRAHHSQNQQTQW